MKGKNVMLGFLAGAAVGGIATLLYAPASGKDLRKNIKENKEDIQVILADIKERIKDMKSETVSASNVSKETIKVFVSDVKERISAWKTDIEPHKQDIQYRIKEIESALGELEQVVSTSPAGSEAEK
ncbi:YtxH domain-containing protein [Bacillus testis]|uniref:YtxH domain-containing protein n=1 Tax=Bacillus testis TaxID=1622072 RepID=UPI00067F02A7|nr:YtxH domain-containing protein [Bacillus testis]